MKTFKFCKIFPNIDNNERQEVIDWCKKEFGPMNAEVTRWMSSSNYTYPLEFRGTFDMWFYNQDDANLFLACWGGSGTTFETFYDEWYTPDDVLDSLFDFD